MNSGGLFPSINFRLESGIRTRSQGGKKKQGDRGATVLPQAPEKEEGKTSRRLSAQKKWALVDDSGGKEKIAQSHF